MNQSSYSSKIHLNTKLGPLLVKVVVPPIVAEYAILKYKIRLNLSFFLLAISSPGLY